MLFANNCNTTLSSSLTNVATTMSVTSATGFPSPTGSQYFYCTLADAATQTTIEIVKVTAVSGTTFTIVRGQDGTTGTIFASGAVVSLRLVAASLNDFPKLDEANTFTGTITFSTPLLATNMVQSTTSTSGYLSNTDWSTFNGKAPATTYTTNYIPFGQGTTTPNQSSVFTYNGTTLATPSVTTTNDASIHGLTVGLGAGSVNTNTVVGTGLGGNSTGSNNTAVGYQAGYSNTTGGYNTFLGNVAGYANTTGVQNTAIGGYGALQANTTGNYNIAIGPLALASNLSGNNNVAIGSGIVGSVVGALGTNTTGTNNTAIGFEALQANLSTNNNTAIGSQAGYSVTGGGNTLLGTGAGYTTTATTTGTNNTYLGYSAHGSAAANTNEIAIGYNAVGIGSNSTVIGNSSTTATKVFGSLTSTGVMFPQQATTAAAPAYVKGGIYFDTTLNKLRVGGATAWETITSV